MLCLTISDNKKLVVKTSGVVCLDSNSLSPYLIFIVEIKPALLLKLLKTSNNKLLIVVFPFVPVIPTNFSFLDGLS